MYPSTQRLQALIAALLTTGGMTAGRESEEANALWAAVERDSARVHPPFDRQWFAALLAGGAAAQIPLTKPEPGSQPSPAVLSKPATELRSDWGDAPAVQDFVGRSAEIATLRRWVVDERCHLLGLYGMGGIGKTSVAAKLARDVAPEFTCSYWRGLRNAPLLVDWLKGAIRFLSGQQQAPPDTEAEQLTVLLQILRDGPCLRARSRVSQTGVTRYLAASGSAPAERIPRSPTDCFSARRPRFGRGGSAPG